MFCALTGKAEKASNRGMIARGGRMAEILAGGILQCPAYGLRLNSGGVTATR